MFFSIDVLWIIQVKYVFIENHGLLSGSDIVPYSINQTFDNFDMQMNGV
jgi:hypothetical protein